MKPFLCHFIKSTDPTTRRLLRNGEIFLLFLLIMGLSAVSANAQEGENGTVSGEPLQGIPQEQNDSLSTDSVAPAGDDFLDASVFYDADSIIFNLLDEQWHLHGNAIVKYEDMQLTADYIRFDTENNEACAFGVPDSIGVIQGKPVFKDGDQEFSQDVVCFNFRTKKGRSQYAITQEGDAYVHTDQAKRFPNDWVHLRKGKFTTCDHEHPHYHFHLTRGIITDEKKIVTGPVYLRFNRVTVPVPLPVRLDSNAVENRSRGVLGIHESKKVPGPQYLQLRSVPTPLALPFAFFPNKVEKSHGIIIPGYGDAGDLGFFLKEAGYYLPINPYMDTKLLFDIYSRGSWAVQSVTNYDKRYKYNGRLRLSRYVTRTSFPELDDFTKSVDFNVYWNHNQDSKARPNTSFGAEMNFGTGTNFTNNLNSSQEQFLQTNLRSSIRWRKTIAGTPFSIGVSAGHDQNTQSEIVNVNVPTVDLNMSRIYPIKEWFSLSTSSRKWYNRLGLSKLGVTGSMKFDNRLSADESEVSLNNINSLLRQMRNGAQGTVQMSTSIKTAGGFVTINPRFNYTNFLAFRYLQLGIDPEDLTQTRDTLAGFRYADTWSVGASATTQLFGTFRVGGKRVQAIRHVLTPTVGFSYTPFNSYEQFGFFGEGGEFTSYNPFEVARYVPGTTTEAGSVNFSLANNLEMKVQDRNTAKEQSKKIRLIDRFVLSSSYNMLADSLNLSDITMSGNTTVAQRFNVSYTSRWSAYDRDSTGAAIGDYLIDTQGKLLRMRSTNIGLNVSFSSRDNQANNLQDAPEADQELIGQNTDSFVDFNEVWNLRVGYNLNLNRVFNTDLQADSSVYTSAITLGGDFTVLERWKVTFQTGYDVVAKDFTTTNVGVYWDMHCWELAFNYIPFGLRQSYTLQLNVKSALLRDLKLQRRGNLGQSSLLY